MIGKVLRALRVRRTRYAYFDAITGEFVSKAYAKANPATTVREKIG